MYIESEKGWHEEGSEKQIKKWKSTELFVVPVWSGFVHLFWFGLSLEIAKG